MPFSRRLTTIALLTLLAGCSPAPTAAPSPVSTAVPVSTASTAAAPSGAAENLGLGEVVDPTLGNPGYDVGHYDIALDWDPDRSFLEATVTVSATATQAMSSVNLDFIGFEVEGVTVDGKPAEFGRTERDLTVRPAAALTSGQQFELAVRYRGKPATFRSPSGAPVPLGWTVESGVSYVVAEPDGARSWFPCNDVTSDKATFTFRLTAPEALTAAANGVLAQTTAGAGRKTWVWQMDRPMATYLATVIIGNYKIVEDRASSKIAGVPIRNMLPADESSLPNVPNGLQGQMVAFMARYLGPYPFAAYGVAYVPSFGDALECQTLTVSGLTSESVLAHELSHQWLGDYVSPAHWQDVWLNEGFATYMEWMWDENRGFSTMRELAARQYGRSLLPPGNPPAEDLFNDGVYNRGALTLYALRVRIGDKAFLTILRTWVDRYGGKSASTADFIALSEEISGLDLESFFQGWLYAQTTPGISG